VNSGPGGTPVPCEAGRLMTLVQTLRTPLAISTRRYAGPTATQEVKDVGTDWARIEVKCRYGELAYRQRVEMPKGTRYCMECQSELMGDGPVPELKTFEGNEIYLIRCGCISELFCCGSCRETYFVKRGKSVRHALVALEGGVCRQCGVDTELLRERMRRLSSEGARRTFFASGGGAKYSERAMFGRLSVTRQNRLVKDPKGIHWWEADHVKSVADGGGESSLMNFQTLCLACHAEKTKAEAKRRAQFPDIGRRDKRKLHKTYQSEASAEAKQPRSDEGRGLSHNEDDHGQVHNSDMARVRLARWKKLSPQTHKHTLAVK